MAYDKKKLYKQAIETAEKKKCFFIEQLVSFLPCAKKTFYELFPIESDESNTIKEILDSNKVEVKSAMYNKWFKSDNPTLQVALMKLISTEEEAHRLNGTKQQHDLKSSDGSMTPMYNLPTDADLHKFKNREVNEAE